MQFAIRLPLSEEKDQTGLWLLNQPPGHARKNTAHDDHDVACDKAHHTGGGYHF